MLRFSCGTIISNRHSTAYLLKQIVSRSTVAALDHDAEWISAKSFEDIPGPKPLPLIGNTWRFLPYIGEYYNLSLNALFVNYREQFGDIVKISDRPGTSNGVYLFNPDDMEKVLRGEGKWPIRDFTPSFTYYRKVTRKNVFQGMGGTLAAQGEEWQKIRTKINPALMQPRNTKLYVRQLDDVAKEFLQKMRTLKDENEELPEYFGNELNKWGLESIALVALDKRMGCLADNITENSEQQQLVNAAIQIIDLMYQLEVQISYWRYFSTPAWRKFVKNMDFFTEVAWKYIQEANHRLKTRSLECGDLSVMERILLNEADPKIAFVTALDLLFGGIDTTSNSAAILLLYLAKNPEKQENLYDELKRILPTPGEDITAEKLEDMKYLRACLKESMRMSPIAFGNARILPKDMVLSNFQVPEGTNVFLMHGTLSVDEKHFPQPDKFIPERWLKGPNGEPSESKQTHPFVYMPFGFGPRMCIGRRFAELEIHILVARIIRSFNVEYNYDMKLKQRLILKPSSPLKFKIVNRY